MDNMLSPREIQARVREGASAADVAAETGMSLERVEAFAGPVIAEREHIAATARKATVRRRGESGGHRRLGELIETRLAARGVDSEMVVWNAWRQPDLKWRIEATVALEPEPRQGEFTYDPKSRFSVALNADARWLIGEEQRDAQPEDENTVDFDDELALVRAVTQPEVPIESTPGDDVPASDLMNDGNEDTSQLDRLYDMLSGISEDSVRIYTGIEATAVAAEFSPAAEDSVVSIESEETADPDEEPTTITSRPAAVLPEPVVEPVQEPLVEGQAEETKKPKPRKGRAKVPSWDEIMFGSSKK